MSYDRAVDQVCPHIVNEEALFPLADAQTVRPIRPIASANFVTVWMNGAYEVPSFGYTTPAQVVGLKSGPFNVTTSTNTLVLKIDQGPVQTLTLTPAQRMPPVQVADLLNRQAPNIEFFVYDRRQIGMRSRSTGRSASIFTLNTSTLASVLGFNVGREVRGKDIAPGWTLVNDPNTLNDRPSRLIVFDRPLRSSSYVEISYNTVQQECRRCGGLGIENDWRYGTNGEVAQVRDEALLIQESMKLVFTLRGSNPFHSWYGSGVLDAVGKKLSAGGVIQNLIVTDIYDTFSRWQSIKKQQEEKVGQEVTDREFPYRLVSVNLQVSDRDPTVVFVNIAIQNRSLEPIQLERGLKLPEPLDLLGSTQQQGIFRRSLANSVLVG